MDKKSSHKYTSSPKSPTVLLSCIAHSSHFHIFSHNPVYQERSDLDPQGHLSDWSREGEERTRERTNKRGAETKTGVWKHQWCLSQVGLLFTRGTLVHLVIVTFVVNTVAKNTRTSYCLVGNNHRMRSQCCSRSKYSK